jgi:hypothetical protein
MTSYLARTPRRKAVRWKATTPKLARLLGIAEDLARHSPALDDRNPDELVPHVNDWLQHKRVGRRPTLR